MYKEIEIPNIDMEPLAHNLGNTFIQRQDLYARQMDDGRYICVREPLESRHLIAHLQGKITLGTYLLDEDSQARYIVLDADDDRQLVSMIYLATKLTSEDVPSYLETSRRGGHLWLFFGQQVPGRDARVFGKTLMETHGLEGIELFPKQDRLRSGPGSLVRLPFGIHRRSGKRYGFITLSGRPLANTLSEQIQALGESQTVSESAFGGYRDLGSQPKGKAVSPDLETPDGTLSQRIKDSVSVHDFVSQYIELSPVGRGLCPFHSDNRKSFSVNTEENYWNCFAGCGGGSIIDFWMKLNDCDFKTAVRELAEKLL
jgi:hypothetical protein